jgi:hypothetical protein
MCVLCAALEPPIGFCRCRVVSPWWCSRAAGDIGKSGLVVIEASLAAYSSRSVRGMKGDFHNAVVRCETQRER